jgi:hypothetical protein
MLSRSSKSSTKRIRRISVMQTHRRRSTIKVALIPREKDRVRMASPRKTSRRHKKRRVVGSRRRTLESGVSSTKSLGTSLINVAPNNHCWLRQKPQSWMQTQTLIHNRIRENKSLTQNPFSPSLPKNSNYRSLKKWSPSSTHICG